MKKILSLLFMAVTSCILIHGEAPKTASTNQQELKYIQTLHKKELRRQLTKRLKLWSAIIGLASYIAYDKKLVTQESVDGLYGQLKQLITDLYSHKQTTSQENSPTQTVTQSYHKEVTTKIVEWLPVESVNNGDNSDKNSNLEQKSENPQ